MSAKEEASAYYILVFNWNTKKNKRIKISKGGKIKKTAERKKNLI